MIRHSSNLRPLLSWSGFTLVVLLFFPLASKATGKAALPSLAAASASRPNLAPLNINLGSYSGRPGDQIAIAWTITNSGSGFCPASFTGVHLGQSATTRPVNDSLSLAFITPEIGARSSVRQTNTVTIPFNAPVGTHYLWVVADDVPSSTLNQTTRADDAARSSAFAIVTVLRQPNLIPQNVTLSASAARPGDQIAVMWTLANTANVTCPTSLTGFHLGTSSTAAPSNDGLNLRFETPEINASSAIRFTNLLTIPTNTALGTYYIWTVADDVSNSTLNQISRADDAARSSALSVVSVITRPNLVPQNITLSSYTARPGDKITVMWSVTNSGNGNCPASMTGLHLGRLASIAPTNDALNLKIATPSINTNSFVRQTNTITIPASTTLGNYYLWIVADDVTNSELNQISRADDAARSAEIAVVSVIRRPNLIATNVVLSTRFARPGDEVTATWTLTNSGNGNCPASQTGLRLGGSATVPSTNSILTISIATPEIRTNAFLRQTNIIRIPTNAPLGTNYVWVIADDVVDSPLNQSSKIDDAAVSGSLAVVTVLPQPNLVPSNVTLSSYTARPGDPIVVTWILTNSGSANCPASVTGLYLSRSPTAKPTNDLLLVSTQTSAINRNASLRQTNVVTLPPNTTTGIYYLWVVADDVPNSTLDQSSRLDDTATSSAIAIARVTLISPAASATADAPPTFEWNPHGGTGGRIYLAAKPSPALGADTIVLFNNPPGTNKFKPSATAWMAAVKALGFAPSYFWTIGSPDQSRLDIYADWRGFKTTPLPLGGTILSTSNGRFEFQIAAPNQAQVIIEASEALTNNWVQIGTVQNVSGTVTYTDPSTHANSKRFFRVRP